MNDRNGRDDLMNIAYKQEEDNVGHQEAAGMRSRVMLE